MYTIEKFCCKLSLKVGTLIIAGFATFFSACYFLYSFVASVTADASDVHYEISIPVTLSSLVIDTCLLFGAIKESRYFMLPYIILTGSALVILFYLGFILSVAEPFVLLIFVFIGPFAYCWLCVYSFYESLDPNKRATSSPSMASHYPPMGFDNVKYPEVV